MLSSLSWFVLKLWCRALLVHLLFINIQLERLQQLLWAIEDLSNNRIYCALGSWHKLSDGISSCFFICCHSSEMHYILFVFIDYKSNIVTCFQVTLYLWLLGTDGIHWANSLWAVMQSCRSTVYFFNFFEWLLNPYLLT